MVPLLLLTILMLKDLFCLVGLTSRSPDLWSSLSNHTSWSYLALQRLMFGYPMRLILQTPLLRYPSLESTFLGLYRKDMLQRAARCCGNNVTV
ncbi:hypothetical protein F4804DRAFT_261790 [Jackrogersella minutella]|nr:hypothetical protein F4804DRAFT_261790 [Jackrogersella minutella]